MYCPNCGNKTPKAQKFCRACGLGLEQIATSLSEQLLTSVDESLSRKDRLERLGVGALSVFGLGILSLIVYGIGSKLIATQGSLLTVLAILGLVVVFGCGLLSAILFAMAKDAGETAGKRRLQLTDESAATSTAPTAPTTRELLHEGHFEPLPSVTDGTTQLLHVEQGDARRR